MDDTIKLVNAWAHFRESHRDGGIEEFCRHYLISKREEENIGQNFGGLVPPQVDAYLTKLMGRIMQYWAVYSKAAFEAIPEIRQFDDFIFLNSVRHLCEQNHAEPRKTDVINYNLTELSSGIDIMNRLRNGGLIDERPDPQDKRAKLVKISEHGEKVLFKCYAQLSMCSDILWSGISDEDKKLCIQLLKPVELKHATYAAELKGKSLAEMIASVLGVREKSRETSAAPGTN